MPASPIEVVGQWMQNLLDPNVVNRLVAPDATYVSLNTEDAELNKIMPWAGTSHGPQAFLGNLGEMFTRWENQAFNVTTMFASGENVAVFGDFRYKSQLAGQGGELPVLDPGEGRRREGDLPAVPRGQLRHRGQLPHGRLLDRPDAGRRRAVPGLTFRITGSAPVRADTAPERSCHLNHRVIGIFGLCPKEPTRVPRSRR